MKRTAAVLLMMMLSPLAAFAQAPPPGTTNVEVEPITCWWRSSTSAVRSGEPFNLMLTCQVVETETTKVVPDQSKLDSSVVQLQPFEVIGGSHAPDMRVPGKRFFQYEYRLRLINEGAFGADVDVPQLQISYRIDSQVARGEAVSGRDLNYNLQPISIRLMSIVPEDTMDIREAPAAAFQAVEARLTGTILFGLAGVVLLVMLVNMFRQRRVRTTVETWRSSPRSIAAGVKRELSAIRQQSRGGWDSELAGRALAATRIAATLVSGRAIGQSRVRTATVPVDGQLMMKGWMGRSGSLVSGSLTSQSTADSAVASSLETFTRARYGRDPKLDGSALDEALEAAIAAAGRSATAHSWLTEMMKRKARD
jgi:hypothetical protein